MSNRALPYKALELETPVLTSHTYSQVVHIPLPSYDTSIHSARCLLIDNPVEAPDKIPAIGPRVAIRIYAGSMQPFIEIPPLAENQSQRGYETCNGQADRDPE